MQQNVILPGAVSSLARVTCAAALGLCATLLGCSDDSVNMGEGVPEQVQIRRPGVPRSSRCAESPILEEEEIVVHNQKELNALEGCEVIQGSLYVAPFKGAQLRALHALTTVRDGLVIGETPDPYPDTPEEAVALQRLLKGGWLSSLQGLEALETAGTLSVLGLASEDLEPLSGLRWLTYGYLRIESAPHLKNFDGLQKLTGLLNLRVLGAPQLESFDGLTLPRSMDYLELESVDLRQLKPLDVVYLETVFLSDTQLHDLTPFANLGGVTRIQIWSNHELESLAGLEGLDFLEGLDVGYNEHLLEIPDFEQASGLKELRISANYLLARLPAFPALGLGPNTEGLSQDGEELILQRPEVIQLQELSSVTTFSMPAGWTSAAMVQIENNPRLRRIEFTGQTYVDYLSIQNNPLLDTVSTGVLEKVNEIHVVDNPRFSVSALASVRHLDLTASGNADAP